MEVQLIGGQKGRLAKAERFKRVVETVKQDLFIGATDVEDRGVDTMIMFVRPAGGLGLTEENLTRSRDDVISQL